MTFFESIPATEEEIARLHSRKWVDEVKQTQWWRVSLYSIGGVLQATEKVLKREIDNALVIAGVGGHHAHATILLQQGVNPKIVQERLGHSSVPTTLDIYSHVLPGLQEAAARQFEESISHTVLQKNVGKMSA